MNNYPQLNDMEDSEIVNIVASQVAKAGNRSERRRILKALNKTKNIEHYTTRKVNERVGDELIERTNKSFGTILSSVGLTLHYDYSWNDEEIGKFIELVSIRLEEYKDTETALKELEEVTGIELVVR